MIIQLKVPDAKALEVSNTLCNPLVWNYQALVPDPNNPGQTLPNPETRVQFIERKCNEWLREVVTNGKAAIQAKSADAQARQDASSINFGSET